jgi:hypothetical protein
VLDKISIDKIEDLAGRGLNKKQIALCLGVNTSSLMKYQIEFPEFQEAYERGKAKATAAVAGQLMTFIKNKSLGATIFWLKAQAGWQENIGIVGADGGAVAVTFVDNV